MVGSSAVVAAGLIGAWLIAPGYRLALMLTFGPMAMVMGVSWLALARVMRTEAAGQEAMGYDPRDTPGTRTHPPMPLPLRRRRAWVHACIAVGVALSMATLGGIWAFLGSRVAGAGTPVHTSGGAPGFRDGWSGPPKSA